VLVLCDGRFETDFSNTNRTLVYGPYTRLPYGEHEITFKVNAEGLGDCLESLLVFDVAEDLTEVGCAELIGQAGADALRSGEVKIRFFNGSPSALFEFRIHAQGQPFKGKLAFLGASLRQSR
jgi:hypothetical protein